MNRQDYMDMVLKYIDSATGNIYMCIHTLNSSRTDKKIEDLQLKLERARASGQEVKILAPCGIERLKAAHEIANTRKLDMKMLAFLENEDFRFTAIGNNISILSMREQPDAEQTAVIIKSERLNYILRNYFNEQWNRTESCDFDSCARKIIHNLEDPKAPPSDITIADRTGLPISEVTRLRQTSQC